MENLIETLRSKWTGYGHFSISIEMDGKELEATTTNTMAIDAAFDDCYDDKDNSGSYYESRREAQEALVNEILRANKIESSQLRRSETFVCGHPPKRTYLLNGIWHCEECGGKWKSIANE